MCLTDKIVLQTHVTFCEYLVSLRDRDRNADHHDDDYYYY